MIKHGETNARGERWDRPSMAWVPADVWEDRQFWRNEAAFRMGPNQGELTCPMIISDKMHDGHDAIQSMATGKWYDSKSRLRREYKDLGMVEVGNDSSVTDPSVMRPRPKRKPEVERVKEIKASVERAVSQVNLTSYRSEEIR